MHPKHKHTGGLFSLNITCTKVKFIFMLAIYGLATSAVLTYLRKAESPKQTKSNQGNERKNVLFIIVDDLRPQLSPYHMQAGEQHSWEEIMHTPNIEALAKKSLLVKRAYAQVAHCCPSRSSFLTGRRPDTTHVYGMGGNFRKNGGNFTTLPQYFKQNGYTTIGIGKVFHGDRDAVSWTEPFIYPHFQRYAPKQEYSWLAVPKKDYEKNPLMDQVFTEKAIEVLQRLKRLHSEDNTNNFFLAVGFKKPHLAFIFPEEYLDLYPMEKIEPPSNPYVPSDMPHIAWADWGELRSCQDIARLHLSGGENVTLPTNVTLDLRRAYSATVSYIDHQVGLVLQELEKTGLADNTVVAFLGDHGWMLGEHGGWCKHNNFELSTHTPLMFHVPGLTDKGIVTDELVEFVDIFPTVAEAAGLPSLELCTENSRTEPLCREGLSLLPLMNSDATDGKVSWKDRAFSQYPRWGNSVMGYSMRTSRYRYTEWPSFNQAAFKPDWSVPIKGVELYDHDTDPEENHNVADKPEYAETRKELSKKLREGWRPALPEANNNR